MKVDAKTLRRMLRELDDPDHVEGPADYTSEDFARFERLAHRLEATFGSGCRVDRNVQDASFRGRIDLSAEVTASGRPLVLVVSNFGSMAVLAVDNPGAWSQTEFQALIHPHDMATIEAGLDEFGFVLVPEDPLWDPYDGVVATAVFGEGRATWWTRFFDYI